MEEVLEKRVKFGNTCFSLIFALEQLKGYFVVKQSSKRNKYCT